MSIATWKDEFYPCPSSKIPKRSAARHSLRKWEGLLKRNRKKHGVTLFIDRLLDTSYGSEFVFNCQTCALCVRYLDRDLFEEPCWECPLYQLTGTSCLNDDSLYMDFIDDGNPMPMIRALRKLVKQEIEAEKETTRAEDQ